MSVFADKSLENYLFRIKIGETFFNFTFLTVIFFLNIMCAKIMGSEEQSVQTSSQNLSQLPNLNNLPSLLLKLFTVRNIVRAWYGILLSYTQRKVYKKNIIIQVSYLTTR